jgi:integrase
VAEPRRDDFPNNFAGGLVALQAQSTGEAIALSVADVEFLKRRISVRRNAVQVGQDFEVGPDEGYLKRPSYEGWFNRAVERANVQTVTPHDLRHTCASLAISAGANVLAVSRMLGHKDPSVTLRVYSDLFDSDLNAVAVNLDAKITDSVQSACRPAPQASANRVLAGPICVPVGCPRGDLNPHAH